MTVKMVYEEGIPTLTRDPISGYQGARKQGNLASAVLYLSTVQPGDWCPWMASRLEEEYPTLSYGMAACFVCLAYVRYPISFDMLGRFTIGLLGEGHREEVMEAISKLEKNCQGEFEEAVRHPFSDERVQLNSNWQWLHLPEMDTVEQESLGL